MQAQLVTKILSKYNLKLEKIFPIQKGYRNIIVPVQLKDKRKIAIVVYKNEDQILNRIRNIHSITDYLRLKRFPVRSVIQDKKRKILTLKYPDRKTRYICLYYYLPGKTICWEAYTMKHIKLLGKTMSDMHAALADFSSDASKFEKSTDILNRLHQDVVRYFSKKSVKKAMKKKLGITINIEKIKRFDDLFFKLSSLPNQQPLHLDFVRSNILFDKNKSGNLNISGVLDFEKAAIGPTIIDVARTLAFLIVDCKYKPEIKVRKYFLHSGYKKHGKLELKNLDLLNPLMEFFWLYDFYKFLLHNPYEDLPNNEHFVRTINRTSSYIQQ